MPSAGIKKCCTEYEIRCGICGWTTYDHQHRKDLAAETFRNDGWTVGKKNICPDCKVGDKQ